MDRKTLVGIVTSALISGCFPSPEMTYDYKGYSRHDVDQLFRDDHGYRIYYDDEQGIVHEQIYPEIWHGPLFGTLHEESILPLVPEIDRERFKVPLKPGGHFFIVKDLPYGAQGFASILRFGIRANYDAIRDGVMDGEGYYSETTHVEVHLPKDQNLFCNQIYDGKQKTYNPMHELK